MTQSQRRGLGFMLAAITLLVASEKSGPIETVVLMGVALIGYLFLRSDK